MSKLDSITHYTKIRGFFLVRYKCFCWCEALNEHNIRQIYPEVTGLHLHIANSMSCCCFEIFDVVNRTYLRATFMDLIWYTSASDIP